MTALRKCDGCGRVLGHGHGADCPGPAYADRACDHTEKHTVRESIPSDVLHILRNPWGHDEPSQREARLRAADMIEEYARERAARNAIDPVTRLHNLCDGLAEHRRESPYNAESLELADQSYRDKCAELTAALARNERLVAVVRDYFAARDRYDDVTEHKMAGLRITAYATMREHETTLRALAAPTTEPSQRGK